MTIYFNFEPRKVVENCSSQKTNLRNCQKLSNGGVVVLERVELWSENDGLMDDLKHQITFFNTTKTYVEDFLKGRTDYLDFDDSLSSNSNQFDWSCPLKRTKIRQAIRLSHYYQRIKKLVLGEVPYKPKDILIEKAIVNHFQAVKPVQTEAYVQPGLTDIYNKNLIGVAIHYSDEWIELMIAAVDQKQTKLIRVTIVTLATEVKRQLQLAVEKRLIIMIPMVEPNLDGVRFDHYRKNCLIIFDDFSETIIDSKYASYLTVRI